MTVFGKRLSEYVAFAKPFLALILVVGIARLALSLGGVSSSVAKWISITAVMWIGVLYYSIRVHTSGFGSYKQLLPICVLQSVTAQLVIVPAIILAIFTGKDNIYSVPEYALGSDGKTWLHVAAHLLVGTTIGPLIAWLVGCVIMFATKKLVSKDKDAESAARA
jgi:hypothetical protein